LKKKKGKRRGKKPDHVGGSVDEWWWRDPLINHGYGG